VAYRKIEIVKNTFLSAPKIETRHIQPVFLITFVTLVLDQVSKWAAVRWIQRIYDFRALNFEIRLEHAENPGAFLSLGSSLDTSSRFALFVGIVSLIILFCLLSALSVKTQSKLQLWGLSLLGAGGLGNLIDRISHGTVTDFLWLSFLGLHTGVFNVADMAIMAGVLFMLIEGLGLKIQFPHKQKPS